MLTAETIARQLAPPGKHASRGTEGNWNTWCPCHKDDNASFSVMINEHGYPVPYCHRGCRYEDLTDFLKGQRLWPENKPENVVPHEHSAKKWTWIADYDYHDALGNVVHRSVKLLNAEGKKTFVQKRKASDGTFIKGLSETKLYLYRYPQIIKAGIDGEPVFIQEGEKDCETLVAWSEGFLPTTCNPMGALKWKKEYTEMLVLAGIKRVYIIPDNDETGEKHANEVALSCDDSGIEVFFIKLPDSPPKGDLTDWKNAGHKFDEFCDLVAEAKAWQRTEIPSEEEERKSPFYQKCLEELKLGPAPDRDRANGIRHARLVKDLCRYTKEAHWLHYDGGRYVTDDKEDTLAMELAKKTVDTIFEEVKTFEKRCPPLSKRLKQWADLSQGARKIRDVLVMARSQPELKTSASKFDANPYWVNCKNGIVDIRTLQLIDHSPEHLLMKQIPVKFDLKAKCPKWMEFLQIITGGDAQLEVFLQEALGYSITGVTKEQLLFVIEGPGGNGKSLLLDTVGEVGGDFTSNVQARMFMRRRQDNQLTSLTQLFGARFVNVSEINDGEHMDEALVKDVSGGTDKITGKYLYAEPISFKPQCKLWFRGNYKPSITGTDEGIWRRMCLIPLTVTLEEFYPERTLEEDFKTEHEGILAWLMMGANRWFDNKRLIFPEVVLKANAEYRAEQDTIGIFCAQMLQTFVGYDTKSTEIYAAYKKWAIKAGHTPLSQKRLGTAIGKRFLIKRDEDTKVISYKDVIVRNDDD